MSNKISLTAIKNMQKNIFKGLITSNYKYLSVLSLAIYQIIFSEMN